MVADRFLIRHCSQRPSIRFWWLCCIPLVTCEASWILNRVAKNIYWKFLEFCNPNPESQLESIVYRVVPPGAVLTKTNYLSHPHMYFWHDCFIYFNTNSFYLFLLLLKCWMIYLNTSQNKPTDQEGAVATPSLSVGGVEMAPLFIKCRLQCIDANNLVWTACSWDIMTLLPHARGLT